MTGDRRLTVQEMLTFKLQEKEHKLDAMKIIVSSIVDGHDEPTLFEVAFIEIAAKLDAMKEILIRQGKQLRILQDEVADLKGRVRKE